MIAKNRLFAAAAMILLLAGAAPARADDDAESKWPDARNYFRQDRFELDAGAGLGVFNSNEYLLLLLGGAYYPVDGFSVGVTGEAWLGSSPSIGDVSPQVRYVFLDMPWGFKPYAGAFYRRTFYDRLDPPINSGGGRAGLVFPLTPRAYATGGLVYEHYFSCQKSVYSSCDQVYPEIGVAFTF
jgi:hypothetical protein